MKRLSGLKLLDEREGIGSAAQKGDRVVYTMRLYLNRGDEVPLNEKQAEHAPKETIRIQDGVTLIDRTSHSAAEKSSPVWNTHYWK